MNAETRAKEIGMAPEERAWEVACNIVTSDDTYNMAEKIASAIRQAENDKLEEAAQRAERLGAVVNSSGGDQSGERFAEDIAESIRSLKKD